MKEPQRLEMPIGIGLGSFLSDDTSNAAQRPPVDGPTVDSTTIKADSTLYTADEF